MHIMYNDIIAATAIVVPIVCILYLAVIWSSLSSILLSFSLPLLSAFPSSSFLSLPMPANPQRWSKPCHTTWVGMLEFLMVVTEHADEYTGGRRPQWASFL